MRIEQHAVVCMSTVPMSILSVLGAARSQLRLQKFLGAYMTDDPGLFAKLFVETWGGIDICPTARIKTGEDMAGCPPQDLLNLFSPGPQSGQAKTSL
jgi:hypothetical protein